MGSALYDALSTSIIVPSRYIHRYFDRFFDRDRDHRYHRYRKVNDEMRMRMRMRMRMHQYFSWCTIGIILSIDYYTSTIAILKASSFPTSTQFPSYHHYHNRHNHHNHHCISSIVSVATNRHRGLESCFLQREDDDDYYRKIVDTKTKGNGYSNGNNTNKRYNKKAGWRRTKQKDVLTFGARISYTTDPTSLPPTDNNNTEETKTLTHFFQRNHGILLRGGHDELDDEGAYQKLPLSSDSDSNKRHDRRARQLIRRWREQCVVVDAPAPDLAQGDYVAEVETQGITIGGIEIVPTSVIGVKIVEDKGGDGNGAGGGGGGVGGVAKPIPMPEFQGVLISNEPRARGPRPVVWLFNKILYGKNNPNFDNKDDDEDDNNQDRQTTSLVRVWTELIDDDREGSAQLLVFRATTFLQIKIFYPRTLSRLFPMGKGTAEKLCSGAIAKALEKNLFPAMKQFYRAYNEYIVVD